VCCWFGLALPSLGYYQDAGRVRLGHDNVSRIECMEIPFWLLADGTFGQSRRAGKLQHGRRGD
jgi:hypothetical protein